MLELVLTSVVVSSLVAYITSRSSAYSKDITEERTKWREKIRDLSVDAHIMIWNGKTDNNKFRKIVANFRLNLNPDHCEDKKILRLLEISVHNPSEKRARKLLALSSRLMKHDWERAKFEAGLLSVHKTLFKTEPNEMNMRFVKSEDYLRGPIIPKNPLK